MSILKRFTIGSIKKNYLLAFICISGIILSTILVSTIVILVSTLRQYSMQYTYDVHGKYDAIIYNTNLQQVDLDASSRIVKVNNFGYASYKQEELMYINVIGVKNDYYDMASIDLVKGRLPENDQELLLPMNLVTNSNEFHLYSTMEFNLGYRAISNQLLTPLNDVFEHEYLIDEHQRTFKIVGFYKSSDFDQGSVHTAITSSYDYESSGYLLVAFDKNINVERYLHKQYPLHHFYINQPLQNMKNLVINDRDVQIVLILIVISLFVVLIASSALIYNIVAISYSYRFRQYGILKSIGTTSKQLLESIFIEMTLYSMIGIVIGLILGIFITGEMLYLTTNLFKSILHGYFLVSGKLKIFVSVKSIIFIVVVMLIVIVISSYIPYLKLKRSKPMDLMRNQKPIKIGHLKDQGFLSEHLGIEYVLAKRNRKIDTHKYQIAAISLIISIVLFITSTSLISHIQKVNTRLSEYYTYDLLFMSDNQNLEDLNKIYQQFILIEDIEEASYITFSFDKATVLTEANKEIYVYIAYVDDITYQKSIVANGIKKGDGELYYDLAESYDASSKKYMRMNMLKERSVMWISNRQETLHLNYRLEKPPLGIDKFVADVVIIRPYSSYVKHKNTEDIMQFFFRSSNHNYVYHRMQDIALDLEMNDVIILDYGENLDGEHARLNIMRVFSFVFVFIFSLLAMVSIFATVRTNILQRKRQIAMLNSIGISRFSLHRMLVYESIGLVFYAFIIGLVISVALSYGIYKYVYPFGVLPFRISLSSIILSFIVSLFIVVITIYYSLREMDKVNIIEIIKHDLM